MQLHLPPPPGRRGDDDDDDDGNETQTSMKKEVNKLSALTTVL